jgi:endonuclease YncB( thermonuclease family)
MRRRSKISAADWRFYRLGSLLVLAVFVFITFWPPQEPRAALQVTDGGPTFSCSVASVTDGDTLRCADGTRVRLHAVAAREKDETCSPGHPCPAASGAAATAQLASLVSGQTLRCSKIGTSYNRVTAICRNESGTEVNCAMVRSGAAVVWERYNSQRAICG